MAGSNSSIIKALYNRVKQFHCEEEKLPSELYEFEIQHKNLLPKLRPYQEKAVRWMLAREQYKEVVFVAADNGTEVELPKGGILADEMGLGKTVEVLACILANPIKNLEELKQLWSDKVVHIPKAYECLSSANDESADEVCVTQSIDISGDHCYSTPGESKRSSKRRNSRESNKNVSFVEFVFEDDDNEEYGSKKKNKRKQQKRKSEDPDYEAGSGKKRKRKQNCDSDGPLGDSVIETPKKKQSTHIRAALNNWYEAMLLETSPVYLERKRQALKAVPELQCCCSDDVLIKSDTDKLARVKCPVCSKFQHTVCVGIDDDEYDMGNPYLCFQCWPKQELVPSGATLIISPASISNQWLSEIDKHIQRSGLNVLVYEGVRGTGYLQPTSLARYDIVLTTYQVLIKELDYVDSLGNSRSLRYAKKFLAPSSPLTNVLWWRLCLDEAQMVECTTTKLAAMVRNLTAINKWAVCGTPIQKSIDDLYGLFSFLQVNPYSTKEDWPRLVRNKEINLELVPRLLWRMSKNDVINEIGVPPQSIIQHWLEFSPVEIHFYQKQHSDCAKLFMDKLAQFGDTNILLDKLDRLSTRKLLAPLLRLRQACVHPQLVRGEFVALRKTMTMEELLKFMLLKAVVDCEQALRLVISSLNGIAALLVIQSNVEDAVDHYREVLHLIQEYDGKLKADSLQKIHTMHNLAEILECVQPNVPRTLRDDTLRQDASAIEEVYMTKRKGDMDGTKRSLDGFAKAINEKSEGKSLTRSKWWANVLENLHEPEEYLNRLKMDLETSKTPGVNLLAKFSTKYALIEEIYVWLETIESNRLKIIGILNELEQMPQNELAQAALACHLKQKPKEKRPREKRCLLCRCETCLKSYEAYLFSITNKSMNESEELDASTSQDFVETFDESVDEPKEEENRLIADLKNKTIFEAYNAGNWQASQQERALRMLLSYGRSKHSEKSWLDNGQKQLSALEIIKKEFRSLRLLWTQMFDYVAARDELSMAKVRLRLPYPGEKIKKSEKNKDIHIVAPHQVDFELARLKSTKAEAECDLKKKFGTLLYLQNLEKRGDTQSELCPICHNQLTNKWSVLSCGHYICFECIPTLLDMSGGNKLVCATCRATSASSDISHIEGEYEKNDSDSIPVKGSHTTKIQSIVKELLKLKRDEPDVKVLIFSTWERVLDLLGEAFTLNDISYKRLSTSPKQRNSALAQFKTEKITALLMPIKHGAKGLNLIEATRVFLVEPLLDPGDELQAIGRVHRIGQTRETFVHRFVVRNTIEEKMLFAIEVGGKEEWSKEKLTVAQLADLFTIGKKETNVVEVEQSHSVENKSDMEVVRIDVTSRNTSCVNVTSDSETDDQASGSNSTSFLDITNNESLNVISTSDAGLTTPNDTTVSFNEVSDVVEVSDLVEVSDVVEVRDVVEVSDAVEVSDVVEVSDLVEVSDVVEVRDVVEVSDAVEVSNVVEVSDAVEVSNVVEVSDESYKE